MSHLNMYPPGVHQESSNGDNVDRKERKEMGGYLVVTGWRKKTDYEYICMLRMRVKEKRRVYTRDALDRNSVLGRALTLCERERQYSVDYGWSLDRANQTPRRTISLTPDEYSTVQFGKY